MCRTCSRRSNGFARTAACAASEHGPRQHIFAVRRDLMDERTYRTLLAVARIVLHTRNGPIFDQIERAEAGELQPRAARPSRQAPRKRRRRPRDRRRSAAAPSRPPSRTAPDLAFWNGFGGFAEGGRDYVVRLAGERTTPHPWINVISNTSFGFHTSAEGASFTWSRNSRDFQLTPWTNDPVTNRPGEAIYIYDQASERCFSPFAAVVARPVGHDTRRGTARASASSARRAASSSPS